jgi:hypothetical protein
VRAAAHRIVHRVGRRGAVLACKGLMALLYGCSQLVAPIPNTAGIRLLLLALPPHVWAWTWVAAGAVALVCVPLPSGRDWPGFAAVYLVASAWALSNLASWWLYGNARGWISAVLFAAFGGVAAVAAAWPEPGDGQEVGGGER